MRFQVRLRTNIMGETAKNIKPLSETRCVRLVPLLTSNLKFIVSSAIQNGAESLAEAFLFAVGASLILAEAWRSNRSQARRRDDVDDKLDDLKTEIQELRSQMNAMGTGWEQRLEEEHSR